MRRFLLLSACFVSSLTFSQNPFLEWVTFNDDSRGLEVIESNAGNVFSVGRRGNGDNQDCFIRKFDENGNLLWEVFVGDLAFGIDGAAEGLYATIDSEESIYTLGTFEGTIDMDYGDEDVEVTSQGNDDIFLVKYDTDGNYLWYKSFGGTSFEDVSGITFNSQNELIISGRYNETVDFDPNEGEFLSTADGTAGFILKLTAEGDFIDFIDIEEDIEDGSAIIQSMAVDAADNIFIVGRFSGEVDFDFDDESEFILNNTSSDFSSDGFVLKLTNEFEFLWVYGFLTTNFFNHGIDVSIDEGLLITGNFTQDLELFDGTDTELLYENQVFQSSYYVMKISSLGAIEWLDVFINNSPSAFASPSGLAIDIFGDVYITGSVEGPHDFDPGEAVFAVNSTGSNANVFLHKLNGSDGSFEYAFDTPGSKIILGGDIFIGNTGNLYINGGLPLGGGNVDFDPNGESPAFSHQDDDSFLWKLNECFPLVTEINVSVCETFTTPSGDETYTESGTYSDTIQSIIGCDSIITIDLTILESTEATVEESACTTFTWDLAGTTYTESGNYETTIPNAAGCDSIVTLALTINDAFDITETETACDSFIWDVTGETLTESNTYIEEFTSAQGCDSTRTLELTILEESSSEIDVFACDEYETPSGENNYTESGTYQDVILNAAGCDSLITIDLEIGLSTTGETITAEECFSFTSPGGQEYTESGEYTEVYVNAAGCDSIVPLSITINTVNASVITIDNFLEAEESGATYQWLDCNDDFAPIADATEQGFQPVENGSYAVEVSNAFCTDTSDCEMIIDLSVVSNGFDQKIGLYPNPSEGDVFLSLEQPINDAELRIYTISGELVQSYSGVLNTTSPIPFKEDLRGTFIIEIVAEGKKAVLRATRL